MAVLRIVERSLLSFGVLALVVYVAAQVDGVVSSRAALAEFRQMRDSGAHRADTEVPQAGSVDFALWSPKRIANYRESLTKNVASPVAVLKIPKIHVEVPVFDGTDELTLNRGVGLIAGTAGPEQPGNVGIAGHRDGFFRGLKEMVVGDVVEFLTADETREYAVDAVKIVEPEDVSVLEDRGLPTLTLVTCYPFYFVGNAPQRWIVQCSLREVHRNDGIEKGTAPQS